VREHALKQKFLKESDSMFIEAKRAVVASKMMIPPWFIVLTVALGWNEFMTILRNPLLTIVFVLAMGITYLVWFTNMTGPVLQVAKAGTKEFWTQAKGQLKERGFDVDNYSVQEIHTRLSGLLNQVHVPKSEEVEMKPLEESSKDK
jgi:hypothetical protein